MPNADLLAFMADLKGWEALADRAEPAYQRDSVFPEHVKLILDWSAYCASPVTDGSNITQIRAGA
jgi:hypothetical protein